MGNIEIIQNIKNTQLYEHLENKKEYILTLEQFPGWDQDHCFPTFTSNNQINPHAEKFRIKILQPNKKLLPLTW